MKKHTAIVVLSIALTLLSSCSEKNNAPDSSTSTEKILNIDQPLRGFAQSISSEIMMLTLSSGQQITVSVTIQNTSQEPWSSSGAFPLMLSYQWLKDGKVLPIEGQRTQLTGIVKPGDTVKSTVRVIAPNNAGELTLSVTMVQEKVAWFSGMGASTLKIPVTIK